MKKHLFLAAVAAIVTSAAGAHAAEVYDQTVVHQTSGPNAGYLFFGTGNQPDNFATNTVTTANGDITIGLRAAISGAVGYYDIDGAGGVYNAPVGFRPGGTNHAAWNYVYSIDLGANNPANFAAMLTITDDVTHVTGTYNALLIPDNSNHAGSTPSLLQIQQNSENPLFGYNGGVTFDPNALDTYTISLSLYDSRDGINPVGDVLTTDVIHVDVIPTPLPSAAGMGLLMLGVAGAAGLLRKKLRTA